MSLKLSNAGPVLHKAVAIHGHCRLGPFTEIGMGTRLSNIEMDAYSYCDRMCALANARIGKFANIAASVRIGATDHPMEKASQHHFLYRSDQYRDDVEPDADWFDSRAERLTHFGHDTWIGAAALVKPDVRVGHGAVVAAGAVVTKDVEPYWIVAGVPAKPIRRRFSEPTAQRLMALAWWEWDHATLRGRLSDFRSLSTECFLDRYGP